MAKPVCDKRGDNHEREELPCIVTPKYDYKWKYAVVELDSPEDEIKFVVFEYDEWFSKNCSDALALDEKGTIVHLFKSFDKAKKYAENKNKKGTKS
jgi:hypothetical protein